MQPIVGKAHRFGRAGDIELSEDYFYAIVQIGADESAVVMFVQALEPTMSEAPYHSIRCNVSIDTCQDEMRDLEEICDYIDRHDEPGRADYVLEQIEKAFSSLSEYPERGNYPAELLDIGIREYCEIFFRPYRIIYRVIENNVYVLLIADGRRDMQTLLQRRLLWA